MQVNRDTIAAVATPPGRGGVGIIRISGAKVRDVAVAMLGHLPKPRQAEYLPFLDSDGQVIDVGLALFFPTPHSFTGEDVLELHGHGGPVVLDSLLQRILQLNVRLARPGEFSEQAFLNNKLDLAQAEAIADLIDASSAQAARAAVRSLQGEFSRHINHLVERLIALRMYVEAAIDFPEEEIDFLSDNNITTALTQLQDEVSCIKASARQGTLLREGMTVVIAGKPNAGKSSLLNRLSGRESAIVTDIPGTTRDVLREYIHLDGLPLHIIDTAGLRESADVVEQEGIRRAWDELSKADHVLLVMDSQDQSEPDLAQLWPEFYERLPASIQLTIVRNKIDLTGDTPHLKPLKQGCQIALSAKTGEGFDLLKQHLKSCMGYSIGIEGGFMARRRHLIAIEIAEQALANGQQQLQQHRAGELLAEELRQAQLSLAEITGEFSADDLLGKIFASFCIGK